MDAFDTALAHFGVKGMHWGVRKDRTPTKVTVSTAPGGRIKTSGGRNQRPAQDAVRAAKLGQRAQKSKVNSLSNKELEQLIRRMNLEKQYSDLKKSDSGLSKLKKGNNIVKDLIDVARVGQQVYSVVKKVVK